MLLKLYEPILWRSLAVANAHVRRNAATLFVEAFPLQDPSLPLVQLDELLQRQVLNPDGFQMEYVYICIYVRTYIYTYIYIYIYACVCVCLCVCVCVLCLRVCMYAYILVCMHACMS